MGFRTEPWSLRAGVSWLAWHPEERQKGPSTRSGPSAVYFSVSRILWGADREPSSPRPTTQGWVSGRFKVPLQEDVSLLGSGEPDWGVSLAPDGDMVGRSWWLRRGAWIWGTPPESRIGVLLRGPSLWAIVRAVCRFAFWGRCLVPHRRCPERRCILNRRWGLDWLCRGGYSRRLRVPWGSLAFLLGKASLFPQEWSSDPWKGRDIPW